MKRCLFESASKNLKTFTTFKVGSQAVSVIKSSFEIHGDCLDVPRSQYLNELANDCLCLLFVIRAILSVSSLVIFSFFALQNNMPPWRRQTSWFLLLQKDRLAQGGLPHQVNVASTQDGLWVQLMLSWQPPPIEQKNSRNWISKY